MVAEEGMRSILRDASRYTGATYLTQVGSFVVGLVTKGLLGPTNVGIWSLLNILLSYLAVVQIGTGDAVAKEVPYLRQKGERHFAERLANAMLGFVLSASAVVAVGVVIVTLWRASSLSTAFLVGLLVVGVSFPLWMFVNMQTVLFRAAKRFDVLSRQLLAQLAVTAAVGIPLIWRWSIYGQYSAFIASTVLTLAYLRYAARGEPAARSRPTLDREASRRLLAVGLPLQLSALVFTFQTTADSLLAAKSLGVAALGYYSLAVTVKAYVYQTPNAFSVIMFPRFQEKFAASQDEPRALQGYVEKPIIAFAFLVLPVLIGVSWQVVPFVVRHFLPSFIPAIPAIKVLLVGSFFASLWHMPMQFLVAVNKLWHGVGVAAANAVLVILGVVLAVSWQSSVVSVAAGTSAAYFVGFLGVTWYTLSHFRSPWSVAWFLSEVVGAGALLFALLVAADRLIPSVPGIGPDLARLAARSTALLVTAAPLFWRADRALNLRQYLRRKAVPVS